MLSYSGFHCFVNIPPVFDDTRICFTPGIYKGLKLFFLKPHFKSSHGFEGTDGAAVSQSQFSYLTLLPEMSVDTVFYDRDFEHLGCGLTIDIAIVLKYL